MARDSRDPADRCALWLRVSGSSQDTASQLGPLEAEAARRGLEIARVFDVTASGYAGQQERQLTEVVDGIRRREYATVICWAIDRLTRQGVGIEPPNRGFAVTYAPSLCILAYPWRPMAAW